MMVARRTSCLNCHEPGGRLCSDCLRAAFVTSFVNGVLALIVGWLLR